MELPRLKQAVAYLKDITSDLADDVVGSELLGTLREVGAAATGKSSSWPALKIGNLNVPTPIVQGGMGVGISLSGLASAVANAGGIGVVAANGIGLLEPDYYRDGRTANLRAFRREIRDARSKSDGAIGVNIMVAVNDFHELLDVAIEEEVDIVFMGAGLPIKNIPVRRMREKNVAVAPIVSSVRATEMIFRMWKKIYGDVPDAIVFEGPLAGGHLGFTPEQLDDPEYQLEAIVPDIVTALRPFEEEFEKSVPVIAGGGVYTGEDIYRVLRLGAGAVQMGTRFVATDECDADERFKEAYVRCREEDIGLIHSPVGMPGRAIRNDFIRDAEEGRRPAFRCAWQCLASCKADDAKYCISIALNNARKGNMKGGFVFAGANAYRIEEIVPVSALIGELASSYRIAVEATTAARLEDVLGRLRTLRERYRARSLAIQELRRSYEMALAARVREAREISDSGVKMVREKYEQAVGELRRLRLTLAEELASSWTLISHM